MICCLYSDHIHDIQSITRLFFSYKINIINDVVINIKNIMYRTYRNLKGCQRLSGNFRWKLILLLIKLHIKEKLFFFGKANWQYFTAFPSCFPVFLLLNFEMFRFSIHPNRLANLLTCSNHISENELKPFRKHIKTSICNGSRLNVLEWSEWRQNNNNINDRWWMV